MSAPALEMALRRRGIACQVEARDRLAILTPEGGWSIDAGCRRELIQIARAHGFTHVALELLVA